MIHFDIPKEQSSIIKVIGMGGGGSNAVNFMYSQGIEGVDFIICNTDSQALADSSIPNKVHLGPHLTQGLGAGANPDIGRQATEESMEELKKILEVNTKMAFITAGMGGGTGTGGTPIVAKICKELGILTVGIVTSPFTYEGRRRMKQAEEGIQKLKEYVDTLLVISNDKLRMQFGNLPFKSAFAKADNILATAAKCITDVINIHGVVNVDFADVCTAMRNGGVAILGSATADGDHRSQKAIDSALSSPLLNDSEIRGAKWILLNITSAEGEHEHTIDEMDTIQAYVQQQAGDECDVILGMGHDNTLEDKLGVTIIATGFEQKPIDQVIKKDIKAQKPTPKIRMELGKEGEEKKMYNQNTLNFQEEEKEEEDPMAPKLVYPDSTPSTEQEEQPAPHFDERKPEEQEKQVFELKKPESTSEDKPSAENESVPNQEQDKPEAPDHSSVSGGYLPKPSRIYAEEPHAEHPDVKPQTPAHSDAPKDKPKAAEQQEMQLFFKKEDPSPQPQEEKRQPEPKPEPQPEPVPEKKPEPIREEVHEEVQEGPRSQEKQRLETERTDRLRRLSFDVNNMEDPHNVETVPAYIRKQVLLQNQESSSDTPYSGYHINKTADGKQTEISTINTFLEGKKPD